MKALGGLVRSSWRGSGHQKREGKTGNMGRRRAGWIGGLAACGRGDTTRAGDRSDSEFLTVDVFDSQANYQGIQSGWFASAVRERFNMELNLISPNTAGGGDTLCQTRSANGNLGDLILIRADRNDLSDMVQAGLVLDLAPYLSGEENLTRYQSAIERCSDLAGQEGLWAVPSEISLLPADEPSESTEPTNGADLRFDLYEEIGAPKIATLEDLLPVLEKMQEAAGTSDPGEKVYAISLFRERDDTILQNAGAASLRCRRGGRAPDARRDLPAGRRRGHRDERSRRELHAHAWPGHRQHREPVPPPAGSARRGAVRLCGPAGEPRGPHRGGKPVNRNRASGCAGGSFAARKNLRQGMKKPAPSGTGFQGGIIYEKE